MNTTINSINLLLKILWKISNNKKKIEVIFVIIFSIFSSIIQYLNILVTAFIFSFITTIAYSGKDYIELDLIFWNKIQLTSESFITLISIWIISSILTYSSLIITSYLIYKISYSFGNILSRKIMNIAISSNSIFYEDISEKTLFNLFTAENTMLIKESIFSLISLPMQLTTIIALVSIVINYSITLLIILPLIGLFYFLISNFIFKNVKEKGKKIFDLRSLQTDILTRIIDNYLDVKFPPSDKGYKKIFNDTTANLRNIESFVAAIPKVLKAFLELKLILILGIYIFYTIYILKVPIDYFMSSSAAIILSLLKITPVISGISSSFLSFTSRYESIKNYNKIIFKTRKYDLFNNYLKYARVLHSDSYELNFDNLKSKRISRFNTYSFTLRLKDKKLLWITGKSGCGKSTFLSMVAGIRPISEGDILLSLNKRFKKKNSIYIHENVAYMPQSPSFHSITVIDYIRDGALKLNKSRIKRIAKQLKLSKSFGLTEDKLLYLKIGPRGFCPSGGQAKLLAFARALYKENVYIYLLDEPTSDLSKDYKEIVQNSIYELSKEKFVLSITHDLNLIRKNDQVLSL